MLVVLPYRSKASGPRLGVVRAPNRSLQKANNLAATYRAGQKQKKEDAARPPIRIAATLWDLPEKRGEVRGKMIQVDYPQQSGHGLLNCGNAYSRWWIRVGACMSQEHP